MNKNKTTFKFEDKVKVLEGFYKDCIGYVKKIEFKKLLGMNVGTPMYIVQLDNGNHFRIKDNKTFSETNLTLVNKEVQDDKLQN